jgi:general secretion pathway protein H
LLNRAINREPHRASEHPASDPMIRPPRVYPPAITRATAARRPAFTLLELVLVMVIICIALAVAAPSLSGWARGNRMRNVADQVIALTQFARSQSVATSSIYRLKLDAASRTYYLMVQDGQNFAPLGNEIGRQFTVPDEFGLQILDPAGQSREWIDFYPNGRAQAGKIRVTSADGAEALEVESLSPAEPFRLVQPGAPQ